MSNKENKSRFINMLYEHRPKFESLLEWAIYSYIQGWENSIGESQVALESSTETMAELFFTNRYAIMNALKRMESAGIIGKRKILHGMRYTTRLDVARSWKRKAESISENSSELKSGSGSTKNRRAISCAAQQMKVALRNQRKLLGATNESCAAQPSIIGCNTQYKPVLKTTTPLTPHGGMSSSSLTEENPAPAEKPEPDGRKTRQPQGPLKPPSFAPDGLSEDSLIESPFNRGDASCAKLEPLAELPKAEPFREPITRSRPTGPLVLTAAQRGLAAKLLGSTGEDAKLGQICTQAMADKPDFLEYCLNETLDALKRGKVKGRAFTYLRQVIVNQWDNGDWVNPETLKVNADLNAAIGYFERNYRHEFSEEEFQEGVEAMRAVAAAGGKKREIEATGLDKLLEIQSRKAGTK